MRNENLDKLREQQLTKGVVVVRSDEENGTEARAYLLVGKDSGVDVSFFSDRPDKCQQTWWGSTLGMTDSLNRALEGAESTNKDKCFYLVDGNGKPAPKMTGFARIAINAMRRHLSTVEARTEQEPHIQRLQEILSNAYRAWS